MKEFEYPISEKELLRKKTAIKRQLLQSETKWIEKKIAILGGSTIDEIVDQLELFLLNYGIKPVFYKSDYGKYYEDAVFGNPKLDSFSPDIIYVYTNWRNIQKFPSPRDSKEEIEEFFLYECNRFKSIWEALRKRFHCTIIQNNFERPNCRLLGNRDIWDIKGHSNFIFQLNDFLYKYAENIEDFYINDIDYISASVGLEKWNNSLYWHMYKYACGLDSIPYVAASVSSIIKSLYGKNKKLLAVDLDNTIWGGVVGEDGADGLELGKETPKGEVFSEIQSYIKSLKEIGVVLAVNSKNDFKNAIDGLHHPDSVLSEDDFVAIEANWNQKDENLVKIADDTSLGTDSFVFMDDNPAERDIVSKNIFGIAVPELNQPEDFIRLIDHSGYFETTILSKEDQKKTDQYKARTMAKESKALYSNYDDYLSSLEMKADIQDFEDVYIQRIAQLTNKSNQFNLTTFRYTEDDIRTMKKNDRFVCLYGKLYDKFGDNGVVAVSIGEIIEKEIHIRLWLMSCRVLKRGLEDAMMNVFVERAKAIGCKKIIGYYFPTAKNSMVKEFYPAYGFSLIESNNNGETVWRLEVDDYLIKKTYIALDWCR